MRGSTLVTALLLALNVACGKTTVATASAQDNTLGLYFDSQGSTSCMQAAAFVPVTMYVILKSPAFAELHGWEASIQAIGGQLFLLSASTPGFDGQNTATWPEFAVAYPAPVPAADLMVLVSLSVMGSGQTCLALNGRHTPAIPSVWPLVWPAAGMPEPIGTNRLRADGPDAILGGCTRIPESPPLYCETVVRDADPSWGSLKARYR
jgi:hypothetical protein